MEKARCMQAWVCGLGLVLLVGFTAGLHNAFVERRPEVAIDFSRMTQFQPFGAVDWEGHFSKDLSILFYFNELSCSTCTTEELQNMAQWHRRFSDHIDFYVVVHGQDPIYLHNLQRLGRVEYPIFLEAPQGALGLPRTTLALFRKSSNQVLACYFPSGEKVHLEQMAAFERRLLQELNGSVDKTQIGGAI